MYSMKALPPCLDEGAGGGILRNTSAPTVRPPAPSAAAAATVDDGEAGDDDEHEAAAAAATATAAAAAVGGDVARRELGTLGKSSKKASKNKHRRQTANDELDNENVFPKTCRGHLGGMWEQMR
mmetsp:Transcript_62234/g.167274  ORF Transcript_62234/g.167274 Transcript_62234/m.167274 type:complete len:124 (+) Transcript_62234:512-883(+)